MHTISELQFLLSRSLSESAQFSVFNKTIYSDTDIVEKISYTMNSHGYRSPEFNKNNEVLILGCSQTYGSGIPNEFTWPDFFCNFTNQKYSRLANQGDSIGGQVYKAFKYFEEIGNPKVVLGLFPMYRLEYVAIPEKFISNISLENRKQINIDETVSSFNPNKILIDTAFFYEPYIPKLSKAPHAPEYIIPREFVLFYNFMFIKMLEQYCESHGIKFIWSVYDDVDIQTSISPNRNILKNYLKTSDLLEICHLQKISNCDLNKNKKCAIEFKNHKLYNNAADYDLSKNLGHWGIHLHKHIAERFIEKYEKILND